MFILPAAAASSASVVAVEFLAFAVAGAAAFVVGSYFAASSFVAALDWAFPSSASVAFAASAVAASCPYFGPDSADLRVPWVHPVPLVLWARLVQQAHQVPWVLLTYFATFGFVLAGQSCFHLGRSVAAVGNCSFDWASKPEAVAVLPALAAFLEALEADFEPSGPELLGLMGLDWTEGSAGPPRPMPAMPTASE